MIFKHTQEQIRIMVDGEKSAKFRDSVFETEDEEIAEVLRNREDVEEIEEEAAEPEEVETESVDATDGAIDLAYEQGVDLASTSLVGTGKDGRIQKSDVEEYLAEQE